MGGDNYRIGMGGGAVSSVALGVSASLVAHPVSASANTTSIIRYFVFFIIILLIFGYSIILGPRRMNPGISFEPWSVRIRQFFFIILLLWIYIVFMSNINKIYPKVEKLFNF